MGEVVIGSHGGMVDLDDDDQVGVKVSDFFN